MTSTDATATPLDAAAPMLGMPTEALRGLVGTILAESPRYHRLVVIDGPDGRVVARDIVGGTIHNWPVYPIALLEGPGGPWLSGSDIADAMGLETTPRW